jgi:hypothetical protein
MYIQYTLFWSKSDETNILPISNLLPGPEAVPNLYNVKNLLYLELSQTRNIGFLEVISRPQGANCTYISTCISKFETDAPRRELQSGNPCQLSDTSDLYCLYGVFICYFQIND